jgi:DNA replication licensing factor MCM6
MGLHLQRLIQREGHLIVIDEGSAVADDGAAAVRKVEHRILAVNPNYVID